MKFSIIGTGNTAWFMAKRLTDAGNTCLGIWGRNQASAELLAQSINAKPYSTISEISEENDICFIAVTDSAIPVITSQLNFTNTTLVHTAGSVDINVLEQAAKNYGVLWPVYSIVKTDLPQHRNIPCIWEGNNHTANEAVEAAAKAISDITYHADSEQRKWLHLSAVMSNNFTNHLLAICDELCDRHNIPLQLLLPILSQTVNRISSQRPADVQTGPAKRGDSSIINKHISMLSSEPLWQDIYRTLSTSIENMYKESKK